MTDLVVRKIRWDFDAAVPFMWQPANPNFGLFCNAFTFIAVPFERYIVAAVRKAADRLAQDPDVAAEADAFLRQEAQHAAAHRKHMIALVARYPELERCYEDACSAYDELIDEQPIEFTRPISPTSRRRSRRCSKSFWTTGIHCSAAETKGSRR